MVLLWGLPEEEPIAAVRRALHARGAQTLLVDQRRAVSTRLAHRPDGPVLRLAGRVLPLADVTAAYPRPYPVVCGDGPAGLVAWRHAVRLERELWQWAATTTATVVNRPAPAATNATKPAQTRAAAACGFRVPDTLVTNDCAQARDFADRHGLVIYKGAGGTRTLTGLLDLSDSRRLERLSTCPTYLQRYIPGNNVRVHVVRADVFATEIATDEVDYRRQVRAMAPIALPEAVADRCRAVTAALGLLVAGIDLIRTPEGEWYFLEANTSPGFTFYPDRDQVGAAIAGVLAEASA
jgi:hypothetical protein